MSQWVRARARARTGIRVRDKVKLGNNMIIIMVSLAHWHCSSNHQSVSSQTVMSTNYTVVLHFGSLYTVMDICPLLPEFHGSEIIFYWSRNLEWKETMHGLDRTFCYSLRQSETVLGKNEYLYQSTRNEKHSECVKSQELQTGRRIESHEIAERSWRPL